MEEEKFEIHIKGGFSERKKLKSFSDIVQTNNLNERTRNKLFSIIRDIIVELSSCVDGCLDVLIEYIYEELFSLTKAHIPLNYSKIHYDYDKVIDIFALVRVMLLFPSSSVIVKSPLFNVVSLLPSVNVVTLFPLVKVCS